MSILATTRRLTESASLHTLRARLELQWELRNGEPELRLLPVLKDPSRDFLDVGANRGIYSICALGRFRKVIAVEPHPDLAAALRRIIRPPNEIRHAALSDEVGETVLHIPTMDGRDVLTRCSLQEDANPGFGLHSVSVPTTTMDDLALDNVGLVKIDVEGHESAVLRGGIETLRQCKPTCIVECAERHSPGCVARTFAFFAELGYLGFFLRRGMLRNGTDFDAAKLQRTENRKPVGGPRSPDFVGNFIFVHRDNVVHLERLRRCYPSAATGPATPR